MEFYFHNDTNDNPCIVKAKNIEQAKTIFKATELYPEKYVDKKFRAKDKEGYFKSEYSSVLGRTIYEILPGAYINICDTNWEKIGKIDLSECQNFSYSQINTASQQLLTDQSLNESTETLPVVGNKAALQKMDKVDLRDKHDLILTKLGELEQVKRELTLAKQALMDELKHKRRIIYMIETFLGSNEEIVELLSGNDAPEEEPLHIYQEKLYMDEEMGVWSNGGLGYEDLNKFDEWISKNYKQFLYKPKAVCAFQVRRHDKDYSSNSLENIIMNEDNKKTYFLIRNGDNLYRLWSDIHIGEKVFPSKEEYKRVLEEAKYWHRSIEQEALSWMDLYMFSLLSIQGIIERTLILGNSLRGVVNLCKPGGMPEDKVVLIRDAEKEHWIGDGRPSWYEYVKRNKETIKVGTRVALTMSSWEYARDTDSKWRTAPFYASFPARGGIHIVEEVNTSRNTYSGWDILIRYYPEDEIWDGYEVRKRQRRVPLRLYRDEVLNVDEISYEDIEYYLHTRLYRKDYLRVLPVLYAIKADKLEEAEYEEELVKLLAGDLSWGSERYNEIREAIKWWKLKNKWKRAVSKDEPKAVRMILKKLKGAT